MHHDTATSSIRIGRLRLAAERARIGEPEMLESLIIDLERTTSSADVLAALRLPSEAPAMIGGN